MSKFGRLQQQVIPLKVSLVGLKLWHADLIDIGLSKQSLAKAFGNCVN
jgi:hypothetical protein